MIILAFAENSIQLIPDGTILLHILFVVVMVAILNRTLFRPINKILAEREAQTSGRASEAKLVQEDTKKRLLHYERGLGEARSAGYHLIELERAEALKLRENEINQVREEIRAGTEREKADIQSQVAMAREALKVEALTIAIQIGTQILHRPVTDTGIPADY